MTVIQDIRKRLLRKCCAALSRLEKAAARGRINLESVNWYSPEERVIMGRNGELLDCHRGKPCFVIGNGPSLNESDLRPLAKWITYTMSGFWKHPIVQEWQPTYYCFADPLFFDGSDAMNRFFSDMGRCIKSTNYVVPMEGRLTLANRKLLKGMSTYYVHFQGGLDSSFARRIDFTSAVPAVQSVSQLAIMSAIYMGCSPIYLVGLDHDWLAKRGVDRHFYAGKTIEGHSVAHGDLDRIPYKVDLEAGLRLWNGYERLKTIAANHGCEIINASHGGFLDVFPRASYEQVLKLHSPNNTGAVR
jgi:hypothetical protein